MYDFCLQKSVITVYWKKIALVFHILHLFCTGKDVIPPSLALSRKMFLPCCDKTSIGFVLSLRYLDDTSSLPPSPGSTAGMDVSSARGESISGESGGGGLGHQPFRPTYGSSGKSSIFGKKRLCTSSGLSGAGADHSHEWVVDQDWLFVYCKTFHGFTSMDVGDLSLFWFGRLDANGSNVSTALPYNWKFEMIFPPWYLSVLRFGWIYLGGNGPINLPYNLNINSCFSSPFLPVCPMVLTPWYGGRGLW